MVQDILIRKAGGYMAMRTSVSLAAPGQDQGPFKLSPGKGWEHCQGVYQGLVIKLQIGVARR